MGEFTLVVELLQSGGPYALVAFLGWAYIKKDRQLTELYDRVVKLSEAQAEAMTKMERSISGLRELLSKII